MALSGSFTGTSGNQYVQPKITWSATQDVGGNYSDVTATLTYSRINSGYKTYGTWSGGITINGTRTGGSKYIEITQNSNTVVITATVRVYHNADGSKSIVISADGGISGTSFNSTNCSATITLTPIPREASIIFAPDFNDEENPTITYYNPAGAAVNDVRVCISLTGAADDVTYRSVTEQTPLSTINGTYTFHLSEAERNVLREATLSGKTYRTVYFFIATIINGTWYRKSIPKTFTVINCEPTLDPEVDVMGAGYTLTWDSNKIIRYLNIVDVLFKATPKKGATITSKLVTCGTQSLRDDGQFTNVDSATFIFNITDNRGHDIKIPIHKELVNYTRLSCSSSYTTDLNSNNEATITINAEGTYYDGSFGATDNTLRVEYRYKTSNTEYPEVWTPMTHTISNGRYSATADISGSDYTDTYTIQIRSADKICNGNIPNFLPMADAKELVVKIVPVFDWGENDFNFNVPVKAPLISESPKTLPEGNYSDRTYWETLPSGTYWYNSHNYDPAGEHPGMPEPYGFVVKTGFFPGGFVGGNDYSVMFYTQAQGSIYRLSGNTNELHMWQRLTGYKTLWSGCALMVPSQTLPLYEFISEQPNGIQLVFSRFDVAADTAINDDFVTHTVNKHTVASHPGGGHSFPLSDCFGRHMGGKYLYINDGYITGFGGNTHYGTENGIYRDNREWVLRYVFGV